MGNVRSTSMPVPIALIVDDCAPVNLMFWMDPPHAHPFAMPNSLTRDFAELCAVHDVRGKFTVLPMPCGLGGIDGKLNHVPPRDLVEFLRIVRERIAPRFDITPEILTHHAAYRLTGGFHHLYEDEWVARATVKEMTDYIALALRILEHVGLPATGVTSPHNTGEHNEPQYAQAIGAAQWRVHRRRVTWYFLHVLGSGPARAPWVSWRNPKNGQVVVSIPATTTDPFWATQRPMALTRRVARAAAVAGVDALLSPDGKTGRIRELIRQRCPVLVLTHWQSLFSDGTYAGLRGLERLLERLRPLIGSELAWTSCIELAERTAQTPS
jgi:hypothetical protein